MLGRASPPTICLEWHPYIPASHRHHHPALLFPTHAEVLCESVCRVHFIDILHGTPASYRHPHRVPCTPQTPPHGTPTPNTYPHTDPCTYIHTSPLHPTWVLCTPFTFTHLLRCPLMYVRSHTAAPGSSRAASATSVWGFLNLALCCLCSEPANSFGPGPER